MLGFLFKVLIAIVVFVVIMRLGMLMLGGLATPHPPPEPGLLRRVNLRYRCSICLTEVRMVQAAEELPPPPRHCQEDMDLVAPTFE
ncbi:MAG: hypothetical protein M3066_15235 [Actinomycetota bacterium]|nr:hypothetical protein [Actinomycetota bacterium]